MSGIPAPELDVSEWIGDPTPLSSLRGDVVLLEAFQMLCPGCVSHALPQVQKVRRTLPQVRVVGLHTVFEHHEVTGPDALRAFVHEYRLGFPIGIDRHDPDAPDAGRLPVTMRAYGFQGTPSTVLIDRAGAVRFSKFGQVDDLELGARIGVLLAEPHED